MLSYRHIYHAGNFADVFKHIVLVELLQALQRKPKPFAYIDTHAGAGRYALQSAQAQKNQEYQTGIGQLNPAEWPELAAYFKVIQHYNPPHCASTGEWRYYPGSAAIALHYLRPGDRAWLFEQHSTDYAHLQRLTAPHRAIITQQSDGFQGCLALLPPISRRGLIFIDPSYELKTDYQQVMTTLTAAYARFATGIYALWYPVLDRARINTLETQLKKSGIRHIQLFELGIARDYAEPGMTAAGMIIINPPWTLRPLLASLLPRLAATLNPNQKPNQAAFFRNEILVEQA